MSAGVIYNRERLRNELRRVRTFEEEKRQSVRFLTKELAEAERADDTALTAFIRQQNKPTQDAHEETNAKRKTLAEELTKAQSHTEAAAVARKAVQDELTLLYAEEFPVFAEEAEKITEEAHAKLLALAEPYMAAMRAWQAAVSTWGPLAPAIRDRLVDHENATGLFPDPRYRLDASRVAVFPLPNPAQVFGAVQQGTLTARPRALEPDAVEDEVIEESIAGTG
jgi:hypothetical protein